MTSAPPPSPQTVTPSGEAERWLAEHGDRLFAYALKRLGNRADAEDAVQETLLAAMDTKRPFEGRSREFTWLCGILRHKVLEAWRKSEKKASIQREVSSAFEIEANFQGPYWRDRPSSWPSRSIEQDEVRSALAGCLEDLPRVMRTALHLKVIDGVDTEAICESLAITPTNLWTLIHRAKLRLRSCIERKHDDQERSTT